MSHRGARGRRSGMNEIVKDPGLVNFILDIGWIHEIDGNFPVDRVGRGVPPADGRGVHADDLQHGALPILPLRGEQRGGQAGSEGAGSQEGEARHRGTPNAQREAQEAARRKG